MGKHGIYLELPCKNFRACGNYLPEGSGRSTCIRCVVCQAAREMNERKTARIVKKFVSNGVLVEVLKDD